MMKKLLRLPVFQIFVALSFSTPQIIWGIDDHYDEKVDYKTTTIAQGVNQIETFPLVPSVAQGHEKAYERFFNGELIYRPNKWSDEGIVKLPIRKLANPLEGTFDLSQCGDTGHYLCISTGYRKGRKAENIKKIEIWFAPRFLIEDALKKTTSQLLRKIYDHWNETVEIGIFWTWGGWAADEDDMEYTVSRSIDKIAKHSLHGNWTRRHRRLSGIRLPNKYEYLGITDHVTFPTHDRWDHYWPSMEKFHIQF